MTWLVGGERLAKSFRSYTGPGGAKEYADELVKELAKRSQGPLLSSGQAGDALAALELLQHYREDTGKRVSLRNAVADYVEAARRLRGRPLLEAVENFLAIAAVVKRKDLSEAVEELIALREAKTRAKDGKRPALCPKYHRNTAAWLREFAAMFPGHAVTDLTKEMLNLYLAGFEELSAKSRNDRRNTLRLFLRWAVKHDYLPATHRLLEADGMEVERLSDTAIDFYRPTELRALLDAADSDVLPVIALQALAGLRLEETMRLSWQDVFGIPGHIQVTTAKSKTRQRRLVEIVPALGEWLAPYQQREGQVAARWGTVNGYVQAFISLRESLGIPSRKNGLRHGFVSAHFARYQNENKTAAEAGSAPAMLYQHYRGLMTCKEAEAWFAVRPAKAAQNVIALPQKGVVG